MRKAYLHHEADPEYTKVIKYAESAAVQDLVTEFLAALSDRFSVTCHQDLKSLIVKNESGKQLALSSRAVKALSDGADVYIEGLQLKAQQDTLVAETTLEPLQASASAMCLGDEATSQTGSSQPLGTASSKQAPASTQQQGHTQSQAPGSIAEQQQECQAILTTPPALQPLLERAAAQRTAKNYRLAGDIYQRLAESLPGLVEVHEAAANMWLNEAHMPQRALPHAKQLVLLQKDSSKAHRLLGDVQLSAGLPKEALKSFNTAVELELGRGLPVDTRLRLGLQVSMARALYAGTGDPHMQDAAAHLVMTVLGEDESHWEGLELYATIAEARGMTEDALRVALRLLVTRGSHTGVRALLARALQAPGGLDLLHQELSSTQSAGEAASAAAYAFLATCVKDHGAVDAAISLLRKAYDLEPAHVGYALNLAHALELNQDLGAVVRVAHQAFARASGSCPSSSSGDQRPSRSAGLGLGGGVDLQAVAALLGGIPALPAGTISLDWYLTDPWTGPVTLPTLPQDTAKVEYTPDQLDLLALGFTAAKVLYVGGALTAAARLVQLLEPARLASAKELHTTLIRNEAAYFGCVRLLVTDHPPPSPDTPAMSITAPDQQQQAGKDCKAHNGGLDEQPAHSPAVGGLQPLYICGDSHTLSPGWHHVALRGEQRLLQPVLVTGCKIWHLRPSSVFYPKHQFQSSITTLPQGAQVVMLFGEIDCREGLLLAVQKCKYESLEEGIQATIDIYLSILLDLIRTRGMEVFVHPVPPVLKETRAIVKPFVAALQQAVTAAAATPAAQGRLHYLDFFSDLLLPGDQPALAPDLEFDGTHLAPAYVRYMAKQLAMIK